MCGRFSLITDMTTIQSRFSVDATQLAFAPNYNVAPTQEVLTVVLGPDGREAVPMRWGLIPSWARSASVGNRMINARGETVAERPAFRSAFKRRRCLVLADGFYEWQRAEGKRKRPMRIALETGEPFAFAGLWEVWLDPDAGQLVNSCTIITTGPNELMRPIHDRMPVILPRESEDRWLDPAMSDVSPLQELLAPYASDAMNAYEVSTLVNSPRNNGPELLARVAQAALDG